MNVADYQRLQRQVTELQSDFDRATGALEETKQRLRKEHGCSTVKAAEALLVKLEREAKHLEKQFAKELKDFEREMKEHDE